MPGRHLLKRIFPCRITPARGMGVGVHRIPLGGFCLNSPAFRINYIQYIKVLVQVRLRPLRHVYHLNYSMYYVYMYYIYSSVSDTSDLCTLLNNNEYIQDIPL